METTYTPTKVDLMGFECTGCAACANICPSQAISIRPNSEGFYNPVINEAKCIDCGLCRKICPECKPVAKNSELPTCYAIMANDELRAKSSSGGVFSVLAHEIFLQGGVVCGAAFDENWTVHHIVIDNENDMDKLRGSKYVQSFISEDIFKQLEGMLKQGRQVLFSGTPCQVAGIKAFLRNEYENLLLVDILCTGAPSPLIFNNYLKCQVPNLNEITNINFRDKLRVGWSCTHTTITTHTHSNKSDHRYQRAFLSKCISNKTCAACKYASIARTSDITLGDFWGIHHFKKQLDDKKGTSLYLCNTGKGEKFLSIITKKMKLVEKVPLKYAMQPIMSEPYKQNPRRDKIISMMQSKPFDEVYEQYLGKGNTIGIINFWYVPNRGAVLTNYALHEFLKDEGYIPISIRTYPRHMHHVHMSQFPERFANKYHIRRSRLHPDYTSLKELNNHIGTYMVGSDQVFRRRCVKPFEELYFLNWASEDSKKIACSASFGFDYYDGNETDRLLMNKYLNRFDALSVREASGVNILRNTFHLDAVQIMDPVFYISTNQYAQIADTSKLTDQDFIASYIMWETPEKSQAIEYAAKKLGLKVVNIRKDSELEDWLCRIRNCKIVITDSFHATCFSLLFRKNFIAISPIVDAYDDRISYILNMTGLIDRHVMYAHEVCDRDDLFEDIEYSDSMFDGIRAEVDRSKKWILDALEAPKKPKVYSHDDQLFYAMMDRLNLELDKNTRLSIHLSGKALNKVEMHYLLHQSKYWLAYRFYKLSVKLGFKKLYSKYRHYKNIISIIRKLKKGS